MATITNNLTTESRIPAYVRKHPIISYFFLAFAGTWLLILPLVLDNFELINLSDGATMIFFILSSIAGPNLAAFYVTGVLEGKAGMGRLFRRIFQVRAGLIWYTVALFSFLTIWLIAYSFLYSAAPIANLIADPSLLLTVFLPSMLFGLLIPSIGEEPGWRGFALPHLQKLYGPVIGTLILGILHGFWHLPAFFTPFLGPITLNGFIAFVLTAAAGTFIYTWVFNHTRTSVWIAMVVHASSNAASKLVTELIPKDVELTGWMKVLDAGWINVIAFGITAVALVILTRGTLGYKPD
jgi:uncharacterized protein